MHAERIDGFNPLAVIDAIARKKAIIERGDGPVLMDTVTYRFSGHSPSDASSYREKTEIEEWQKVDSLLVFGGELVKANVCTQMDIDEMKQKAEELILRAFKKAIDLNISPRADLKKTHCLLEKAISLLTGKKSRIV